ncbi:hypothetical protein RHGRI_003036 [Rhododendron griersonianum]|uniref:Protein kinase domain-containing protein n=1 Tax=Rhododendron griersonianum TaxID=479676 RepID=A0AAV6LRB2_9ERIC|nr:hypothetical protein RHGRI_003036 [Rhododendron griersonianum]
MKKKTPRSSKGRVKKRMKGSLTRVQQLGQLSFILLQPQSSRFKTPLESQAQPREKSQIPLLSPLHIDADAVADDIDCILSEDFFCTPDYITPDGQYMSTSLDCNKENIPCPKSPEKIKTVKSKRQKQDEIETEKTIEAEPQKSHSFVSHSAIALRCRVMPPPCIKNPYVKDTSETDVDPFDYQRSKCAGIFTASFGGDGLSRYRTDFHELEQIGNGYFSCVFKALKRIDGCFYAVKQSTRLLRQDTERRKALMEVQAFAALGSHENIVGYYSSWFENERLFIQMELCDHSLSITKSSKSSTEWEALEIMHQGFDVGDVPDDIDIWDMPIRPLDILSDSETLKELENYAKLALDKYNKDNKTSFQFAKIVKANYRGSCCGWSGHYITLQAKPMPGSHPMNFQALVKTWMDEVKLEFCRA